MNLSDSHPLPESRRAADRLVAVIEAQIASGELEDGKPLPPERDLMEAHGLSRTVVREAITLLAGRGFVETRPRFRPVVRKPDFRTVIDATEAIVRSLLSEPRGVENLYQTRVFIERTLVRDAALHATAADIADLKSALSANAAAIENSDAFFRTDIAFHGVLYAVGGNPIFPAVHQAFTAWLSPHWARMERSRDHNAINCHAHRQIYEAILERDPQRAEDALVSHLNDAWCFVKDTFKDVDRTGEPARSA